MVNSNMNVAPETIGMFAMYAYLTSLMLHNYINHDIAIQRHKIYLISGCEPKDYILRCTIDTTEVEIDPDAAVSEEEMEDVQNKIEERAAENARIVYKTRTFNVYDVHM